MTRVARVHRIAVKRRGSARIALTLVAAFAFFIQSFITQTHIHGAPPSDTSSAVATLADHANDGAPYDPFPASEDPVNQVYAGNYAAPAVALLVQPAERIAHVIPVRETRTPDFILSHAWRSRAPPSA